MCSACDRDEVDRQVCRLVALPKADARRHKIFRFLVEPLLTLFCVFHVVSGDNTLFDEPLVAHKLAN